MYTNTENPHYTQECVKIIVNTIFVIIFIVGTNFFKCVYKNMKLKINSLFIVEISKYFVEHT